MQLVIVIVFAFIAALVLGANVVGIIDGHRRKVGFSSIPFLFGIAGAIALALYPERDVRAFFWVPLVLDYTIWGFLYAVIVL